MEQLEQRKPTLEDIDTLQKAAERDITEKTDKMLAALLTNIKENCWRNASIIIGNGCFRPKLTTDGSTTVIILERAGNVPKNANKSLQFNKVSRQFRKDMLMQIINEFKDHTEEIENL